MNVGQSRVLAPELHSMQQAAVLPFVQLVLGSQCIQMYVHSVQAKLYTMVGPYVR